jgi:hypothetical protein
VAGAEAAECDVDVEISLPTSGQRSASTDGGREGICIRTGLVNMRTTKGSYSTEGGTASTPLVAVDALGPCEEFGTESRRDLKETGGCSCEKPGFEGMGML